MINFIKKSPQKNHQELVKLCSCAEEPALLFSLEAFIDQYTQYLFPFWSIRHQVMVDRTAKSDGAPCERET